MNILLHIADLFDGIIYLLMITSHVVVPGPKKMSCHRLWWVLTNGTPIFVVISNANKFCFDHYSATLNLVVWFVNWCIQWKLIIFGISGTISKCFKKIFRLPFWNIKMGSKELCRKYFPQMSTCNFVLVKYASKCDIKYYR